MAELLISEKQINNPVIQCLKSCTYRFVDTKQPDFQPNTSTCILYASTSQYKINSAKVIRKLCKQQWKTYPSRILLLLIQPGGKPVLKALNSVCRTLKFSLIPAWSLEQVAQALTAAVQMSNAEAAAFDAFERTHIVNPLDQRKEFLGTIRVMSSHRVESVVQHMDTLRDVCVAGVARLAAIPNMHDHTAKQLVNSMGAEFDKKKGKGTGDKVRVTKSRKKKTIVEVEESSSEDV
eukprot:gnl/Dysnectes_brevis/3664_a4683_685.p1 GENE.gnl/Dysnectes_brevis/3664_a4683_685~~gnl/Dysnectes_brevis/3664_a4683_685.p1  ORF type:complete len:235 (+),score=48.45 gnl/Dysnectes_brevis/3664_a4683_685:57-761(+)